MTSHSPSSSTVSSKRPKIKSEEALKPSFADLPSSLMEIIMSRLVLKDNIRASAACKSWLDAAVFVRVVEKHPWLFYMSRRGHSLKLVDPFQWKSYTLELPEIAKSTVFYSRDGWLLMHRSNSKDIFFFNPFSRELISLPNIAFPFNEIAFSYPPTSDNCVVVALNFNVQHRVTISTCHPGATEWIASVFPANNQQLYMKTKIVYHNDRFYGFNVGTESLFSFHPSSRTWMSYPHANIDPTLTQEWYKKDFFLAETKGKLFLMLTSVNEEPMVYELVSWSWKKMSPSELDGLTFFVSFYNSELTTNIPSMRNSVCFSRFGYNRQHVSYSFDKSRYNPSMEWHNELELCPPQSLWIDPPNNVLDYL
nr:PREDICTED: F-box protein At4g00893-like [Raphanus sativus]